MSMFRQSVSKANNNTNASVQPLPTSSAQPPQPSEPPDSRASIEETFEDRLKEVADSVAAASDYRRRLAREDEAVSNLIRDFEDYVEQLSTMRGKLEEDADRISKLYEKFKYETSEVNSLRAQIKEQVFRIRSIVNLGQIKPENAKPDEPQPGDQ